MSERMQFSEEEAGYRASYTAPPGYSYPPPGYDGRIKQPAGQDFGIWKLKRRAGAPATWQRITVGIVSLLVLIAHAWGLLGVGDFYYDMGLRFLALTAVSCTIIIINIVFNSRK